MARCESFNSKHALPASGKFMECGAPHDSEPADDDVEMVHAAVTPSGFARPSSVPDWR